MKKIYLCAVFFIFSLHLNASQFYNSDSGYGSSDIKVFKAPSSSVVSVKKKPYTRSAGSKKLTTSSFDVNKPTSLEVPVIVDFGTPDSFFKTGTFAIALDWCEDCVHQNYFKKSKKDKAFKAFVLESICAIKKAFADDRFPLESVNARDYYKVLMVSLFKSSQKEYNRVYGKPVALYELFPVTDDSVLGDLDFKKSQ